MCGHRQATFDPNRFAATENGFHDPQHDTANGESEEDTRGDPSSVICSCDFHVGGYNDAGNSSIGRVGQEERKEHKLNLLSELTEGADTNAVSSLPVSRLARNPCSKGDSQLKMSQGENTTTDGGVAAIHVRLDQEQGILALGGTTLKQSLITSAQ